MEQSPERHIECGECKKPVAVIYTEIIGKTIYKLSMCSDCPILRQKMYGSHPVPCGTEAIQAGLCCGTCGTKADEVKMGANFGCSNCYEVFENILTQELTASERLPQKTKGAKRPMPIHLGKLPGQASTLNPALKLLALHQALHETLSQEDYEQAAWLRDQIKELTEESHGQ
jgi:protein arginine kinase activator